MKTFFPVSPAATALNNFNPNELSDCTNLFSSEPSSTGSGDAGSFEHPMLKTVVNTSRQDMKTLNIIFFSFVRRRSYKIDKVE